MGSKSVKSPPSPDPGAVASAQAGANLQTSIGNTWMQNANVKTPWGNSTTTQQTKQVKYIDPKTGKPVALNKGTVLRDSKGNIRRDKNGVALRDPKTIKYKMTNQAITKTVTDPNTGKTMKVPVFQYETKLSPNQQKLLAGQEALGLQMNDIGGRQLKRMDEYLSTPFNLDGIAEVGDFESYRAKTEDALMSRLNEDFAQDYNKMETRLINQGAARGSAAFDSAEKAYGRNVNDARVQAFLASGAEGRAAGGYDQNLRNQKIQERLLQRNQPINEVTALMSGGQVTAPQMPQFQGSQMGEVPVGQYMYQNWSQNNQRAQQQAAANGAMWSNIGNAAAGMFRWSSRLLKTNIKFVCMDKRGFGWYTYDYLWGGPPQFGVIAEEVASIIPGSTRSIDGYLAVDYGVIGNVDAEQA